MPLGPWDWAFTFFGSLAVTLRWGLCLLVTVLFQDCRIMFGNITSHIGEAAVTYFDGVPIHYRSELMTWGEMFV